jgi:hypothetical protein
MHSYNQLVAASSRSNATVAAAAAAAAAVGYDVNTFQQLLRLVTQRFFDIYLD